MWRHLRKGTLLRNKYRRPWPDAAHVARRLIRAYDICRSWASKVNIFLAPCAVFIKSTIAKVWKTGDLVRYCLFRYKVPFRWWCHIYCSFGVVLFGRLCFVCDVSWITHTHTLYINCTHNIWKAQRNWRLIQYFLDIIFKGKKSINSDSMQKVTPSTLFVTSSAKRYLIILNQLFSNYCDSIFD